MISVTGLLKKYIAFNDKDVSLYMAFKKVLWDYNHRAYYACKNSINVNGVINTKAINDLIDYYGIRHLVESYQLKVLKDWNNKKEIGISVHKELALDNDSIIHNGSSINNPLLTLKPDVYRELNIYYKDLLVGKPDYFEYRIINGEKIIDIIDYKVTNNNMDSTRGYIDEFKYKLTPLKIAALQLSAYGFIFEEHGFKVRKLEVVQVFVNKTVRREITHPVKYEKEIIIKMLKQNQVI